MSTQMKTRRLRVDSTELCELLGIPRQRMYWQLRQGILPPPMNPGGGRYYWRVKDLEDFFGKPLDEVTGP